MKNTIKITTKSRKYMVKKNTKKSCGACGGSGKVNATVGRPPKNR